MSDLRSAPAAEKVEPVTPHPIMQLGSAFMGSKTLLSAVELGLFGALSEAVGARGAARATRPAPP